MLTERSLKSIHENLVEFGYGNLTLDEVRTQVKKLFDGEKPGVGPGMMIESMILESGVSLPEKKQEAK